MDKHKSHIKDQITGTDGYLKYTKDKELNGKVNQLNVQGTKKTNPKTVTVTIHWQVNFVCYCCLLVLSAL